MAGLNFGTDDFAVVLFTVCIAFGNDMVWVFGREKGTGNGDCDCKRCGFKNVRIWKIGIRFV